MRAIPLAVAAIGLVMSVSAQTASAQSMTAPPGSVRGVFGADGPPNAGRTTQQVSTWFDLGGGYDQNFDTSIATDLEGAATTALAAFRYWRGRTTRSLEATGRIFRNDQQAGQTTATGGEVNLIGAALLGRRSGLNVALRAANDSAVLFGAFGSTTPDVPVVDAEINVPDVGPQQGIVRDRWYSFGGNAGAHRDWSPRHRTAVLYTQVRRRPTQGDGLNSDQRSAQIRHDWMFRMNTGLIGAYRLEQVQQTFAEAIEGEPVRTQTAEVGIRFERRSSPIRVFSGALQVGAAQFLASSSSPESGDGTFEPSGSVSASYTLTRRWSLTAGASRGITVLQGVTQTPFVNDLASLTVNGVFARRVTVSVAGSASQGNALGTASGSFEAVGGTGTVRYAFRYGSLFAGYTKYEHRVRDVLPTPGAIAPRFDQRSVRVGITIWLPLYGAF